MGGGVEQKGDKNRGGDQGETCTRGRRGWRAGQGRETEETKITERQRGDGESE